jgi:hypothetical protein
MRIAAVDGGTYFHHRTLCEEPFARYFDDILYIGELYGQDFGDHDVLFLPCRLNTQLVAPISDRLIAFMRGGGTLVVMGEVFPERWLPGIAFTPCETNFWWWREGLPGPGVRIVRPKHPLMTGMTEAAATWHLHGHFHTTETQLALIETDEGALMFEDRESYAPGRLLATTLDPCYHHGSHFMPATTAFLSVFLPALRNLE